LQQEAENVEQEQDACAVQVGEESFVVHHGKLMGRDIADDIRDADDDEQQCIHQAGNDEQRRPRKSNEQKRSVRMRAECWSSMSKWCQKLKCFSGSGVVVSFVQTKNKWLEMQLWWVSGDEIYSALS
jgi:GTP-dependent phosphoenolpyruvate carboxykinase